MARHDRYNPHLFPSQDTAPHREQPDAYSASVYPSSGAQYTGYVGGYPHEDPNRLEVSRSQPGPHYGKGPRNYQRSDERIREDIIEELTYHHHLDASEVDVTVQDGEVTLSGNVPDRQSKRLAEDLAERVRGVRDVHNRLRTTNGSLP